MRGVTWWVVGGDTPLFTRLGEGLWVGLPLEKAYTGRSEMKSY